MAGCRRPGGRRASLANDTTHTQENNKMDTPSTIPTIQKRNPLIYFILAIVTCGIFGFYWMYTLNEDTNKISGHPEALNGIIVILLSLVTCGLFLLFWMYNMGTRIDEAKTKRGLPGGNSGTLYLILTLVGCGLVAQIILQSELNKLAE